MLGAPPTTTFAPPHSPHTPTRVHPPHAAAPHASPGKYQFAYDVDITRDLKPPDDNLLIRVRPAPCLFPRWHASTARVRLTRRAISRPRSAARPRAPSALLCSLLLLLVPAHYFLPRPASRQHSPRSTRSLQVSVLKDVGQFVGPESGSNVGQHGQSAPVPMRPPTAQVAQPLTRGCPLGPRGAPSPHARRGETAAALWCLRKLALRTALCLDLQVELKQGDECYLRRGDVEHLVRRGDLVHILQ